MAKASELMVLIKAKNMTAGPLSAVNRGFDNLAKKIGISSGMLKVGAAAAVAATVAAVVVSVKAYASLEQAITNAASVTGYMGEEAEAAMKTMEDLARTLGSTTRYTAIEAANAMYDLASKGFKPAEMSVRELEPFLNLAAATGSELAFTTEIMTSTLRAFGLETAESARVSDVFAKTIGSSAATMQKLGGSMAYVAPVAKAAGMTIEQTSAFLGALYNTGLDASMAGTAFRGVLATLMSPAGDLQAVLARLDLTMEDISIDTHDVTDILRLLQERGITTAEVMDVFGRRAGPAALSLLAINSAGISTIDTIENLTAVLSDAGGTAEYMANMQLDTLNGQMTILKSQLTEIALEIGEVLLPTLRALADLAVNTVGKINKVIDFGKKLYELQDISGGVGFWDKFIAPLGPISFEHGGTVPGPIGQPVPVIAHGGEKFLGTRGTGGGGGGNTYVLQVGNMLGDREDAERFLDFVQHGLRDRQRITTGAGIY